MNTLRQTARARLRGALLGLTTPFTSAGAFDEEAFRRNVEFYVGVASGPSWSPAPTAR